MTDSDAKRGEWPLYEVFVRSRAGLEHRHVGSVSPPPMRAWPSNTRAMSTRAALKG